MKSVKSWSRQSMFSFCIGVIHASIISLYNRDAKFATVLLELGSSNSVRPYKRIFSNKPPQDKVRRRTTDDRKWKLRQDVLRETI